jgi:alpha-ketoglutarate-dependent taurine dioxygenase
MLKYFAFGLLFCSINALSYSVSFPSLNRNLAVIKNINVKNISKTEKIELRNLFKNVPLLLFKDQDINKHEHYEFCKLFDENHNENVVHFYDNKNNTVVPQIVLKGNLNTFDTNGLNDIKRLSITNNMVMKNGNMFKYGSVWHQDIVGSSYSSPPIVSSVYMLVAPKNKCFKTLFANMENAYDNIEFNLKKKLKNCNVIYTDSKSNTVFDYSGYNRIKLDNTYNTYSTTILHRQPLIIYSDNLKNKKALMLSPFRFNKFDKLDKEESFDLYRELMFKHITKADNLVNINWEKNDLLIYNNRKTIHSNTPDVEYQDYNLLYYKCFLGTYTPLLRVSEI